MTTQSDDIRAAVREQYGKIAREGGSCGPGCCGPGASASLALGYSPQDLSAVPEGANMGLGCGNPQAIAALVAGEVLSKVQAERSCWVRVKVESALRTRVARPTGGGVNVPSCRMTYRSVRPVGPTTAARPSPVSRSRISYPWIHPGPSVPTRVSRLL